MSSIGERQAYPIHDTFAGRDGMTYRQWLIGQISAGCAAVPSVDDPRPLAKWAIAFADEIITQLDVEAKQ